MPPLVTQINIPFTDGGIHDAVPINSIDRSSKLPSNNEVTSDTLDDSNTVVDSSHATAKSHVASGNNNILRGSATTESTEVHNTSGGAAAVTPPVGSTVTSLVRFYSSFVIHYILHRGQWMNYFIYVGVG